MDSREERANGNEDKVEQAKKALRALRRLGLHFKIDLGDIEWCRQCGKLSVYCPHLADFATKLDLGLERIGTCSGLGEWTCGHCDAHHVAMDSPLNSPCFTHHED